MKRSFWPLAVFVVALAVRLVYVHEHHVVLDLDVSQLKQTDNYVFRVWAETIAAGDVLCREQPHAYHHWTREVAPELRWIEWYGGEQTFHQSPLYPYLIAAVFTIHPYVAPVLEAARDTVGIGGPEIGRHAMVGIVQSLLSALMCMLTFLFTRRMLGERAACIAGFLLAFCAPLYFYDAFILRDGFMALLVILVALALDRAATERRPLDWLLAGGALGLFTLGKETGTVLFAMTVVAVAVAYRVAGRARPTRLSRWSGAVKPVALLGAGFLVVLSPAIARNAVVGAPLAKFSTRGPEVFIAGNAQGQDGVGWDPPIDLTRQILMDGNFRMGDTIVRTLATHRSDPLGYARLLWHKTAAFFNGYEVPNNVNFYLHRAHLTSLRVGIVSMTFLGPAALLGLLLGLSRVRRLKVAYLTFGAIAASVIALYVIARFRLQAFPLLAFFAALAVDRAWLLLRARRYGPLLLLALIFTLLVRWCWPAEDPYNERNRNTGLMMQLIKSGNVEHALRYRELVLHGIEDLGDDEPDDNLRWRLEALRDGLATLERARTLPDGSADRSVATGDAFVHLLRVSKRAERVEFANLALDAYNTALARDPMVSGARYGIGRVHAEQNELPKALRSFLDELRVHPGHPQANRDAAMILASWQRWERVPQLLHRAIKEGLEEGPVLALAARVHIDPRHIDKPPFEVEGETIAWYDNARAERLARRALEIAPDDNAVRDQTSFVFYAIGDLDQAVAVLTSLVADQPYRAQELNHRIEMFRKAYANKEARRAEAERKAAEEAERAAPDPDAPAAGDGAEPPALPPKDPACDPPPSGRGG